MRGEKNLILWLFVAALSSTALMAAHALHWPVQEDRFAHIRKGVARLESQLPPEIPVTIRVEGLSDDDFNYLRYCLIPRPLELKLPQTRQLVLLTSAAVAGSAFNRVKRQRPDLQAVFQTREGGYFLTLFKSGR